ncbi:MAG: RNA polymerase sigma factor [Deltaproteobacteria bacterium]
MKTKRQDGIEAEKFYNREYPALFRYVLYLTGDREITEEICQESFMRWFSVDEPQEIDYPRAWLKKVAGRLVVNHFRRQNLRSGFEKTMEPEKIELIATNMEKDIERLEIEDALSRLPWRDGLLLKLRMEGRSYQELAELMDIAPASVGTMLARAMKRFRSEYEGKEAGPNEVPRRGNVIKLFG